MLISSSTRFIQAPFDSEAELERVVVRNAEFLFGPSSLYLPKTLIQTHDGFGTVPDGFAIDISSRKWFIVEAELLKHSVWSHIAPQIAKQIIAASTPATKRLLVNMAVDHVKHTDEALEKFRELNIQDIDIRRVLGEIVEQRPVIGMPIDAVSNDLREWAATLGVNVKLWTVRKLVEFGKPEHVMYEFPEEFRPELDTQEQEEHVGGGKVRYDVTLADLIESGMLKPGEVLSMSYKPRSGDRRAYQATVQDDGSLNILGQVFSAPSYAAMYAMEDAGTSRTTVNGWAVWRTTAWPFLWELREQYLAQREDK